MEHTTIKEITARMLHLEFMNQAFNQKYTFKNITAPEQERIEAEKNLSEWDKPQSKERRIKAGGN